MPKVRHWFRLIFFDTLAVLVMLAALLTGWLPGPGGIPLVLIGLSLLSVNHKWARRYIDLLRKYADRISDIIFLPRFWVLYDLSAAALIVAGGQWLIRHDQPWMVGVGFWCVALGALIAIGNRNRWARLKKYIRRQRRA
jgi:hypothetical protein